LLPQGFRVKDHITSEEKTSDSNHSLQKVIKTCDYVNAQLGLHLFGKMGPQRDCQWT